MREKKIISSFLSRHRWPGASPRKEGQESEGQWAHGHVAQTGPRWGEGRSSRDTPCLSWTEWCTDGAPLGTADGLSGYGCRLWLWSTGKGETGPASLLTHVHAGRRPRTWSPPRSSEMDAACTEVGVSFKLFSPTPWSPAPSSVHWLKLMWPNQGAQPLPRRLLEAWGLRQAADPSGWARGPRCWVAQGPWLLRVGGEKEGVLLLTVQRGWHLHLERKEPAPGKVLGFRDSFPKWLGRWCSPPQTEGSSSPAWRPGGKETQLSGQH